MPDATYTNSVAALNLAYRHGFRYFELDFLYRNGLVVGRSDERLGDSLADVVAWFEANEDAILVTDLKNGNQHLSLIAEKFGTTRVIPQIYHPSEYAAASALGFSEIIFTAYRMPTGSEGNQQWRDAVNALDLWAVTIPKDRIELADGVRHPVFLHTVNSPISGFGLYTDCLIPADTKGPPQP